MDSHRCSNCRENKEEIMMCDNCGAFICASCVKSNAQLCPFCATNLGLF